MVAEEAPPLLLHPIVLKHIKEASVAQLVKQHVHVLGRGESRGDQRDKGFCVTLKDVPAVLETADLHFPSAQSHTRPCLKSKEHEVNPYPGVPCLHGKEVLVVKAVLALPLTGKVQLGMFLVLAFFNAAPDRQRQLDEHLLHVGFDLVQVLLTEMLHSVPHSKRLKHTNSLSTCIGGGGGGVVGDVGEGGVGSGGDSMATGVAAP